MKHLREAWRAELPEVRRSDARTLVIALLVFWGTGAFIPIVQRPSALPLATFGLGFAAGFWFYRTLFLIWGERLMFWPGKGYDEAHRRSTKVMLSLLRPPFWARVARSTGWPPFIVAALLLLALSGDFLTSLLLR